MNILGIDYGEKRIGLALGYRSINTAVPLPILNVSSQPDTMRHIRALIQEFNVAEIVVGYPLHLDGSASASSGRVDEFTALLKRETGLPVSLLDERLTSRAADERLKQVSGDPLKRKKQLDSLAACIILEEFMTQR